MIIDDVPTYFTGKHAVSMTLRDYFAAKVMQALVTEKDSNGELWSEGDVAELAYSQADAMLKAREQA